MKILPATEAPGACPLASGMGSYKYRLKNFPCKKILSMWGSHNSYTLIHNRVLLISRLVLHISIIYIFGVTTNNLIYLRIIEWKIIITVTGAT